MRSDIEHNDRQIGRLVDAILDGADAKPINAKLKELEAETALRDPHHDRGGLRRRRGLVRRFGFPAGARLQSNSEASWLAYWRSPRPPRRGRHQIGTRHCKLRWLRRAREPTSLALRLLPAIAGFSQLQSLAHRDNHPTKVSTLIAASIWQSKVNVTDYRSDVRQRSSTRPQMAATDDGAYGRRLLRRAFAVCLPPCRW